MDIPNQELDTGEPQEEKLSTIDIRQQAQKDILIQQLKKTPIVQVACEKVGIGRTTYYRWHKDDKEFADAADTALSEGSSLINDMAESQLVSAIRDKNLTAIIFWLKHHHKAYATKVEVTANLKQPIEQLSPEQQELVEQALKLASLTGEVTESEPTIEDNTETLITTKEQTDATTENENTAI